MGGASVLPPDDWQGAYAEADGYSGSTERARPLSSGGDRSMPAPAGRAQHPLAALRVVTGHSLASYARAVAERHAELGFGHMACRREKVARWEAG
jgi:hypothetical protein